MTEAEREARIRLRDAAWQHGEGPSWPGKAEIWGEVLVERHNLLHLLDEARAEKDSAEKALEEVQRQTEEWYRTLSEYQRERDNAKAKVSALAVTVGELRAEIARLHGHTSGHEEPCLICKQPCNGFAGNPSLWPIRLGNDGWRHVGCLNDALRELARLREKVHFYEVQYQDEQGLNGAREERDAALAEIARLRAPPPEADVMELAEKIVYDNADIFHPHQLEAIEPIACALTAYGNQRANEVSRLYLGWCELCNIYHRAGNCDKTGKPPSVEAREAWAALPEKEWPVIKRWLDEARAAAIEEAVQFIRRLPGGKPHFGDFEDWTTDELADEVNRALADAPPQSEGGEG